MISSGQVAREHCSTCTSNGDVRNLSRGDFNNLTSLFGGINKITISFSKEEENTEL